MSRCTSKCVKKKRRTRCCQSCQSCVSCCESCCDCKCCSTPCSPCCSCCSCKTNGRVLKYVFVVMLLIPLIVNARYVFAAMDMEKSSLPADRGQLPIAVAVLILNLAAVTFGVVAENVCMLFAFAALEAIPIAVYLAVGRLECLLTLIPITTAVIIARKVLIKREQREIASHVNFDS